MVKKGMRVDMPIYAAHHDPDFFPEPEKFKPERFLKENAEQIKPYTYRPFGGKQEIFSKNPLVANFCRGRTS